MTKVRANRLGLLAFLAFHVFSGLAAAQFRISGLPQTRVAEVWQEKGQLFLKGEDGRLLLGTSRRAGIGATRGHHGGANQSWAQQIVR